MRIALAQINPVVGDIAGNELLITNAIADARAAGAALVCLPELAMTGYPPEDLLLKDHVLSDVAAALERIAEQVEGIVAPSGEILARAPQFEQWLLSCEVPMQAAEFKAEEHPNVELIGSFTTNPPSDDTSLDHLIARVESDDEAVYAALVLGTRDYADKNGFSRVVLGLSGGVDSALVACIARDALGADRVTCVTMPSQYSSEGTYSDAVALAAALGVELLELPIGDLMKGYDELLAEPFAGRAPDLTEENLQARIRGNILMALSNKFGWLVLTTGNKSEMAVGYSTLYGDSAGGFAVIKDLPKLLVYRLCELRNRRSDSPIPASILTRPPSAELRPDQADQDSLPPYEILDPLLEGYVERDLGAEQLVAEGFDAETVKFVIGLVDRAEYKRRQQPPGIKVTGKAFGRDRRMPITNRYNS